MDSQIRFLGEFYFTLQRQPDVAVVAKNSSQQRTHRYRSPVDVLSRIMNGYAKPLYVVIIFISTSAETHNWYIWKGFAPVAWLMESDRAGV